MGLVVNKSSYDNVINNWLIRIKEVGESILSNALVGHAFTSHPSAPPSPSCSSLPFCTFCGVNLSQTKKEIKKNSRE